MSLWERRPGLIIALALGLIVVAIVAGFAIKWATSDVRGSIEAREQTRGSGAFRVSSYDHFFDLCTSIQGKEALIDTLEDERDGSPKPTPERSVQIAQVLTVLRAQRIESISRYNNDALKEGSIGPFRSHHLPERIDTSKEAVTVCAL